MKDNKTDAFSKQKELLMQQNDINALLQATRKIFPEIMTLNLTRDTYRVIQYDGATALDAAKEGAIDELIQIRLGDVVEEDRTSFANTFSGDSLRRAFLADGREQIQLVCRRLGKDGGAYWFESTVMRQENAVNDDVLLVAMSRNVDEQKAEEIRLREQLRLQEEELRLIMAQMGKIINYYDIRTGTFTMPPMEAERRGVPSVLENFPESFFASTNRLLPDAEETIRRFYNDIRGGKPACSCEYRISNKMDQEVWMRLESVTVFDDEGRPVRAVVAAENVTVDYARAEETQQLRESQQILQLLAQHSDRIVCYYDVKERRSRIWDPETCSQCQVPHLCEISLEELLESGDILPESLEELREMFQQIHVGTPKGGMKMRARTPSGERRWFDVQYSTICDNEGRPISALISHKDITVQYEHELVYLHRTQSMADSKNHLGAIEVDLNTDIIENQGGRMVPAGARAVGQSLSDFGRRMVEMKLLEKDHEEGLRFFSSAYLLDQYAKNNRQMDRVWQMHFRGGKVGWVHTNVDLVPDPYTGHVKAFFRLTDITETQEAQLEMQQRSERDGMTGLLNRATAEQMIREKMADKDRRGILILLDLDDLKGINDTFGHGEGDRAIRGMAEELKSHFRESDVIGRIGGDEFMVYLPGASENGEAIAIGITSLLRKLASISVGGNDERRIHCSVGCAVQTAQTDIFELLYRQADIALYHVKRNSKNSFAFYTLEMEQEDYQFQVQRLFSLQGEKKFELTELQHLLNAIVEFYQLVLSVNLSRNDYYLMEEVRDGVFSRVPTFGALDNFVKLTVSQVHPGDASDFMNSLSREALMQAYERGEKNVRCAFRFRGNEGYRWTEATAIFYTNSNGDVCDFTLVRWADERANELEQLWLQKVLELAVRASFEYICLLDVKDGEYFLYGDEANTHAVSQAGNFDGVTREIRDHFIAPEERESYYENAKLSTIVERMESGDGAYTYGYNMPDGSRRASFHWFEPTHTQLLMTVQRCE